MSEYNFTINIDTPNFEIRIDTEAQYGYFEHNELGDECGGGLWFDDRLLLDYDGVYELPQEVQDALINASFIVDV